MLAVILKLTDWLSEGLTDIPCQPACTSKPQQWDKPRGYKIFPRPVSAIVVAKSNSTSRKRQPITPVSIDNRYTIYPILCTRPKTLWLFLRNVVASFLPLAIMMMLLYFHKMSTVELHECLNIDKSLRYNICFWIRRLQVRSIASFLTKDFKRWYWMLVSVFMDQPGLVNWHLIHFVSAPVL